VVFKLDANAMKPCCTALPVELMVEILSRRGQWTRLVICMAPRWWAVAHRVAYTTRVASSSSWNPSGTETVLYTFDYHNPTPGDGPKRA